MPPPTIAIGVWPNRCRRASPITVSSDPTCRLDAVGSKPMYAVTGSLASASAGPSVASYTRPRHSSSVSRDWPSIWQAGVTITQSMARHSPRPSLKSARSPRGVGAATGTSAYGYLYARHQLEVTRADAAGRRPAAGAGRPADRPDHRRPSQPLGLARRCRATPSPLLMAERPDLIVLGGDYVTLGRPAVRRPVRRSARAAVGAARRLRHPRQSRRRSRHAGGAREERRAGAEGRAHAI